MSRSSNCNGNNAEFFPPIAKGAFPTSFPLLSQQVSRLLPHFESHTEGLKGLFVFLGFSHGVEQNGSQIQEAYSFGQGRRPTVRLHRVNPFQNWSRYDEYHESWLAAGLNSWLSIPNLLPSFLRLWHFLGWHRGPSRLRSCVLHAPVPKSPQGVGSTVSNWRREECIVLRPTQRFPESTACNVQRTASAAFAAALRAGRKRL